MNEVNIDLMAVFEVRFVKKSRRYIGIGVIGLNYSVYRRNRDYNRRRCSKIG